MFVLKSLRHMQRINQIIEKVKQELRDKIIENVRQELGSIKSIMHFVLLLQEKAATNGWEYTCWFIFEELFKSYIQE